MSQFAYEFAHWDLFGVKLIRQIITIGIIICIKIDKIRYIFPWPFKYIGVYVRFEYLKNT